MTVFTKRIQQALLVCVFMAACGVAAHWMAPNVLLADQRAERVNLESAVPKAFGEWRLDTTVAGAVVNPQTQEALYRIYDQVLARTYVNAQGRRVMLSIAYGGDQRRRVGLQLHQPEICYPAQGFEIASKAFGELKLTTATLPVRRLETSLQRQRYEPLTYWLMTGDFANVGGVDRRKIGLHYGLKRTVPDGLLFRVSSIGRNSEQEFELQARFVNDLLEHASPAAKHLLAGL